MTKKRRNTVDTAHSQQLAGRKTVERLSSHGCSTESSTLTDGLAPSLHHRCVSLPDAGCQRALACCEMLAVLPFTSSMGSVSDELGALLSRHSEALFGLASSPCVCVARIASLTPPLARPRHSPLCSGCSSGASPRRCCRHRRGGLHSFERFALPGPVWLRLGLP